MRWIKNKERNRGSYFDVLRGRTCSKCIVAATLASVMLLVNTTFGQSPFRGEGGEALRGPRRVPAVRIQKAKPPQPAPSPFEDDEAVAKPAQRAPAKPMPQKEVAADAHDHEHDDHDHEHAQQPDKAPKKNVGIVKALLDRFRGAAVAPAAAPAMVMDAPAAVMAVEEEMVVGGFADVVPAGPNNNASVPSTNSLTIDEDQQRRLKRAGEFAEEGRFDLAVPLWQKVLDEAGEQLAIASSRGEGGLQSYHKLSPVSSQIEEKLASLPPAGLREYRLNVDPEAAGLLNRAQGSQREAALANIATKYFLSSEGDNAAFELACLKLERGEYHSALQLLDKLQSYPDSDVPASQVLVRVAVAQARVGNDESAATTMKELNALGNLTSPRVRQLVSLDIQQSATRTGTQTTDVDGWPMRFGTSAHDGYMPDVSAPSTAGYSEIWEHRPNFPMIGIPNLPANAPKIHMSTNGKTKQMIYINGVIIDPDIYAKEQQRVIARKQLIDAWKTRGGRLAGGILIGNGKAYLDGGDRIVCCDLDSGTVIWSGHPNAFEVDEMSKTMLLMKIADQRYGYSQQMKPQFATASELQLFGDQVHHAMSLAHGMLLTVEGNLSDQQPRVVNQQQAQMMMWQAQRTGVQRKRTNWLTAYDADGGKLLWNRTAAVDGEEQATAGFLCAPIATRDQLLVPVSIDGKCWLYGLRPDDGETIWTAYLGDEPATSSTQYARASVAVDGGEAFVTTGIGTLYAIDATTGSVKWGVQYKQHDVAVTPQGRGMGVIRLGGSAAPNKQNRKSAQAVNDTVIIAGNKVLACASDFDKLFALDRTTGEVVWHVNLLASNSESLTNYALGISHGSIVLAGDHTVRAIDIDTGKVSWKQALDRSYGHGALTKDFVYVPDGHSVVKINVQTGKIIDKTPVISSTDEPLGNLYSDGSNLLVLGLGRLYVLGDLDKRMDELAAKIKTGDGVAYFSRAKIQHRLEKPQQTIADLTAGYDALLKSHSPAEANRRLFDLLDAIDFAKTSPADAIEWILKAADAEKGQKVVDDEARNRVLGLALASMQQGANLSAAKILAIVPYCRTTRLSADAETALTKIVTADDEALMREALKTTDPFTRKVARVGLAASLRKANKPRLLELLKSDSESERLAGATALAVDAHREALPVLGNLLTSRDKDIRTSAIAALRQLTGKSFQYDPKASVYRRRRATTNWQAWINREGKTAALHTASSKPRDAGKFTPTQVDVLIRGGLLVD